MRKKEETLFGTKKVKKNWNFPWMENADICDFEFINFLCQETEQKNKTQKYKIESVNKIKRNNTMLYKKLQLL